MHFDDIRFGENNQCTIPTNHKAQLVDTSSGTKLLFTYEVVWNSSKVSWASRWDTYLAMNDVNIHWYSIINSIVVIFFLSGKNLIIF